MYTQGQSVFLNPYDWVQAALAANEVGSQSSAVLSKPGKRACSVGTWVADLVNPILQVTAGAFQRLEQKGVSRILMPAIGGLVTGIMACQYPEILYQGFGNVNAILQNKESFAPPLLFQILAAKIFVTSVSKGSGLVGGTYAPSIFMGMAGAPWPLALNPPPPPPPTPPLALFCFRHLPISADIAHFSASNTRLPVCKSLYTAPHSMIENFDLWHATAFHWPCCLN